MLVIYNSLIIFNNEFAKTLITILMNLLSTLKMGEVSFKMQVGLGENFCGNIPDIRPRNC